ncbi:hypothetical protein EJ110_NYTH03811 [Nymphaea thermarum]|nr:hypothetical protein EJ110_NYTH03811 [Nymphaea thermarum]
MLLKDNVFMEAETSEHIVFLLVENRWEEPSRLSGSNKHIGKGEAKSGTKCVACRGEGLGIFIGGGSNIAQIVIGRRMDVPL